MYGFVKQSGGRVKIYSTVGEGTTVKIYLPRAHVVTGTLKESDAPAAVSQESEAILVVEDEADVRSYLVETLRDLNSVSAEHPTAARR